MREDVIYTFVRSVRLLTMMDQWKEYFVSIVMKVVEILIVLWVIHLDRKVNSIVGGLFKPMCLN